MKMAATASDRPGGKLLDIFQTSADRQGAYDFVDNDRVKASAIALAGWQATYARSEASKIVHCVVDGSSLAIVDQTGTKGFGNVGSTLNGACGLKVVTAYAVDQEGTPIGVTHQQYWTRKSGKERHDQYKRPASEKETQKWLDAIKQTAKLFGEDASKLWFLVDREGDNQSFLTLLASLKGVRFTIRSCANRRLFKGESDSHMLAKLRRQKPLGSYEITIPAGRRRPARCAKMIVRATTMTIAMTDMITYKITPMRLTVVEALELLSPDFKGKPIEWRLLTNVPVKTFRDAQRVIRGYTYRWRIEEFHKTWKSSACDIEGTQLRDPENVIRFATLMASVASRIERLKVRSRKEPDLPADVELKPSEIKAILKLKRLHKKRTETIPDSMPTLAQAIWWLAELGGYTGKSSGGPPGAITIRRGLKYIAPVALLYEKNEMR